MNKDLKTKLNFSTVFYDVDTQNDFMVDPDIHKTPTALYVPGAEHIRKNLQQLTRYAQTNDYCFIMGSVDRHFNDDKELKKVGCTGVVGALIKVDVIKKLTYPYFQMEYKDEAHVTGSDIYFTKKLIKEANVDLWVDPKVDYPHQINAYIDREGIKIK